MMRQSQAAGTSAEFGNRAPASHGAAEKATSRRCRHDEAKEELQEIIEFLKVRKIPEAGGRIPKGVCSSTSRHGQLACQGDCGRSNVPFFSISGSDFVKFLWALAQARPGSVRTGQEKCSLHHLHQTN